MKYAHLLLSTGDCLASLPLLSRFGVGAVLICSCFCLPLGGEELDMQLQCLYLSFRTVAIHCLLSSAFWKFRSRARWSSPCCHTMATASVLCRLQHSSLSDILEGPISSPVVLPTPCTLEPVKGSCRALGAKIVRAICHMREMSVVSCCLYMITYWLTHLQTSLLRDKIY